MREILFRGKRADNGEWVQGDFCSPCNIVFLENGYDAVLGKDDCPMCNDFEVLPETVGQYTGLTDKNGKKIFEGDIIKHIRTLWGKDNSDIGVILWCENLCKFYRTSKFDTMDKVEIWKDTAVDYEVIGNIHDNPELLKGGAE